MSRPPNAGSSGWRRLHEEALARLGSELEARWLVEEASGLSWAEILLDSPPVAERAGRRLEDMVERRASGEPLQYVIGHWGFRTLDLMVDRRVLIPRPETEQVVQAALDELARAPRDGASAARRVAVDLGTGSGAIALAVAAEAPGVEVWGTDASRGALDVASANLAGLGGSVATRVSFVHGDWWAALPGELRGMVDVVVSNPPYISSAEMGGLPPEVVGWEPRTALEAGASGLEAVAAILAGAPAWLRPGGSAVVEMAPHQAGAASELAAAAGFGRVRVLSDLAGRDRVLVASDPASPGGTRP